MESTIQSLDGLWMYGVTVLSDILTLRAVTLSGSATDGSFAHVYTTLNLTAMRHATTSRYLTLWLPFSHLAGAPGGSIRSSYVHAPFKQRHMHVC